jgi:hypothetical protein
MCKLVIAHQQNYVGGVLKIKKVKVRTTVMSPKEGSECLTTLVSDDVLVISVISYAVLVKQSSHALLRVETIPQTVFSVGGLNMVIQSTPMWEALFARHQPDPGESIAIKGADKLVSTTLLVCMHMSS